MGLPFCLKELLFPPRVCSVVSSFQSYLLWRLSAQPWATTPVPPGCVCVCMCVFEFARVCVFVFGCVCLSLHTNVWVSLWTSVNNSCMTSPKKKWCHEYRRKMCSYIKPPFYGSTHWQYTHWQYTHSQHRNAAVMWSLAQGWAQNRQHRNLFFFFFCWWNLQECIWCVIWNINEIIII